MQIRTFRLIAAMALAGVCVVSLAAQQAAPIPAPASPATETTAPGKLAGLWKFDDTSMKEDRRNWRRPVPSASAVGTPSGAGPIALLPGAPTPDTSGAGPAFGISKPRPAGSLGEPYDSDVRRALRDLLEITPRYQIRIASTMVTFTDDLGRTFEYTTDGRKERRRLGGTPYDVRTTWDGAVLRQDIIAFREFHMTQAFQLSEDAASLYLWMTVDKPVLVPAVQKLTRTYSRMQ